ncbi:MAG TPA: hypothetical protein VGB76_06580 [Pyrinomonadaceae bacterium]|jgi:hypothetical protein
MPIKINWTFNAQVAGGPKVAAAESVEVDAYENIEVVVPKHDANDGTAEVGIVPADTGEILFLLIKADNYTDTQLSYVIGDATDEVALDAQQVFIGAGAVGLLGESPSKLTFTNKGPEDIAVRILVGRKAA